MKWRLLLCAAGVAAVPTLGLAQEGNSALERARADRFRDEVRALAEDLQQARSVPPERARLIAYTAVAEAHRYGVPVPLVFGVIMQETMDLNPRAVSVAGAQGIMQIMPNIWKPVLGRYFGYDLFDDVTNIRYGVWILAHFSSLAKGDWRSAVARYSGGARQYADRVAAHVERRGERVCPSRSFRVCGEIPLLRTFGPGSTLSAGGASR
jgi:soluble lytic murein transglycosylase-like protein